MTVPTLAAFLDPDVTAISGGHDFLARCDPIAALNRTLAAVGVLPSLPPLPGVDTVARPITLGVPR